MRLRGGGGGPCPEDVALGVAPGGLIKQCILEDTNPATIWERDRTVSFNVQILNSDMFQQITGKPPPSTPISAKTYRNHGLPFIKIYGEKSTIKGDFDGIKSVKQLDKITNNNGKREHKGDGAPKPNKKAENSSVEADEDVADDGAEDGTDEDEADEDDSDEDDSDEDDSDEDDSDEDDDADEDEKPLQNPIILLNPDGSAMDNFVPVSELMDELSRMKLRGETL